MSFIIAVHVNEGIVLASDRRTTYTNTTTSNGITTKNFGVHTTNSTDKTFLCPNNAGISTCGDASLLGKPITGYIKEMIRTKINHTCRIDDMPNIVIEYFNSLPTVPNTNFIIAGYDDDEETNKQKIFKINVKTKKIEIVETDNQGATWDGEINTLVRLIHNVAVKKEKYIDLPPEEISWQYFTLQDAVDFSRYAVETTIQTMRFKTLVETVGGGTDILVITPEESKWIQKNELK